MQPKADAAAEKSKFNWEAGRKSEALGLLGLSIPEENGGTDMEAISLANAIEQPG